MKMNDKNELEDLYLHIFTGNIPLLDLRSEIEFAKGAFPRSINIPLLNTQERHLIGLAYKEKGQEQAIRLGYQLVSGDIKEERLKKWCDFYRAHSSEGARTYCFRGGLRSEIVEQWMRERGCLMERVPGGYKAMRRYLLRSLQRTCAELPLLVLGGKTGCGKTLLLKRLSESLPPHLQVCDLEGMVNHRGSAFGKMEGGQPTQINFENQLIQTLLMFWNSNPRVSVVVENEGRSIGQRLVPQELYQQMQKAPLIVLEASLQSRVELIIESYIKGRSLSGLEEEMQRALMAIKSRLGGKKTKECLQDLHEACIDQEKSGRLEGHAAWIEKILIAYYDPTYIRNLEKNEGRILFRGDLEETLHFLLKRGALPAS